MNLLEARMHWRKGAPFHVQIELHQGSMQFQLPCPVEIQGRVVRVFRTDGRLVPGDGVAFVLWICRRGDEPTGLAYVYHDDLVRATHMEVYLHGTPPKCELAAYEFTILNGASDEPTMSVAQLEKKLRSTEVFNRRNWTIPDLKSWWHFFSKGNRPWNEGADWLTKLHEPFFRTQEDAEAYFTRELPRALPEGWGIIRPSGERLTWLVKKEKLEPAEWQEQDYCVRITNSLDFVIFTYGNADVGPFNLHHVLHKALVIQAVMLRRFSLSECLISLFVQCEPNEWGHT